MTVLGVDPTGSGTGAAVARGPDGVVGWWAWTRVRAGWRLRSERPAGGPRVEALHVGDLGAVAYVVGVDAVAAGVTAVVVEGLFVPPRWARKASGDDVLTLAEGAGRTLAGLVRAGLPEPCARPTAKEWRAPFGLATLDERRAEEGAVAAAMREGWLPRGLTVAEQGAVAEAGLMAVLA